MSLVDDILIFSLWSCFRVFLEYIISYLGIFVLRNVLIFVLYVNFKNFVIVLLSSLFEWFNEWNNYLSDKMDYVR